MAPSSRHQYSFDKDEKCLCFHGAFLYEAKILDVQQEDPKDKRSPFRYRVHYKGWKNTWDDWVEEERLRKLTDENKELAENLFKDLRRQQREERQAKESQKKSNVNSKKKSRLGSERASLRGSEERSSSVQAGRGTKRGRDWELEKEDAFATKPSIRIMVPDSIKALLVDDWENITKSQYLVPLPHEHPVAEILDTYREHESKYRRVGTAEADILDELVQGLREYFDKSLGRILLYRFERPQWLDAYETAKTSGKKPSELYGAEHLCRLLVSMPELIAQTNMDQQSVAKLRSELTKLSTWLSRNASTYFVPEYLAPGPEYTEKLRPERGVTRKFSSRKNEWTIVDKSSPAESSKSGAASVAHSGAVPSSKRRRTNVLNR